MTSYPYTKSAINMDKLEKEILASSITATLSYINFYDGVVIVIYESQLTENEEIALSTIISNHTTTLSSSDYIKNNIIIPAREFGENLITDIATENVQLGITQADKTSEVRKTLREVTDCLMTGSLYDAIAEIRLISVESYDITFITAARLLQTINKIETYLGITLSLEL